MAYVVDRRVTSNKSWMLSACLLTIGLPLVAACGKNARSSPDAVKRSPSTPSATTAISDTPQRPNASAIGSKDSSARSESAPESIASNTDELAAAKAPSSTSDRAKVVQLASLKPGGKDQVWSRFRGPDGMGTSSASGLPVTWSATDNIAWKTALPGPGASSPIVFGDHIYLTCYTGYIVEGETEGNPEELKRHLIALRRTDGTILWNTATPAKQPEERRIRDHGFAANTPAADAERVYVFHGKTGVFAFDHDGKQLWQADVGSKTNGWGTSASPVLYRDLVFINASVESGSLVALDRSTGQEKWRAEGIREAWNTPVVVSSKSGRDELVVCTQGKVLAFNPDNGAPLWSCKTDIGWYMVPSPVASDGVVYCLGGRSGVAALAIRLGGDGDVTATHRLWTSLKGSNVASPVFLDGHLYWTHEQRGIAYCAKGDSGEVVYEQRLERAGQFYSSAILADGRLYYLTRDGKTFVLAAKPTFEQLAVNDLGDRSTFNGSPAIDGSRLLIRSNKYLYCVGK